MEITWHPILEPRDAIQCQNLLDEIMWDIAQTDPVDLGTWLGKGWLLSQFPTAPEAPTPLVMPSPMHAQTLAWIGKDSRASALSDPMAALLSHTWATRSIYEPTESAFLGYLRSLDTRLSPAQVAMCVPIARYFLHHPQGRGQAMATAFSEILPRLEATFADGGCAAIPGQCSLEPVQGLLGLLAACVRASAILGEAPAFLAQALKSCAHQASVQLDQEGKCFFGALWKSDPLLDRYARKFDKRIRAALVGHLGVWATLRCLQQEYPAMLDSELIAQIDQQLALISTYSFGIHKKLGYSETGMLSPSLLVGAAGALHLFNKLYQVTGDQGCLKIARLWARRLFELGALGRPKGCLMDGQTSTGRLRFLPERSLAHGSPGAWLVLSLAMKGGAEPAWQPLLLG